MQVTRKIGFYALKLWNNKDMEESLDPRKLKQVFDYIVSLEKTERRRVTGGDGYYFLSDVDEFTEQSNLEEQQEDSREQTDIEEGQLSLLEGHLDIQKLVFKLAKDGRRSPLIHRDTLDERDNPKELKEGERNIVHAVIRYFDNEAIILLEATKPGVTIGRLEHYLNDYAARFYDTQQTHKPYVIRHEILVKHDFLEELRKLRKVQAGQLSISKRLLGSEYLNYSDRIRTVQKDIVVHIKAESGNSIESLAEDLYEKFTTSGSDISRLRLVGLNEEDQLVKLDTVMLERVQMLKFETDIHTGEIKTNQIFEHLVHLSKDL